MNSFSAYRWVLLLALLGLSGCKGECRKLSEQLCDCAQSNLEQQACLTRASLEDGRIGPLPSDEAVCARLRPGCDCHLVNTPQGKRACGLAR